jgi:hypothetical protein
MPSFQERADGLVIAEIPHDLPQGSDAAGFDLPLAQPDGVNLLLGEGLVVVRRIGQPVDELVVRLSRVDLQVVQFRLGLRAELDRRRRHDQL